MTVKSIQIYDAPPSGQLRALEDWNTEKRTRWALLKQLQPNGIACPSCGHECGEAATGPQRGGDPPEWAIQCLSCDWSGWRAAC